jgi:hypothetical protein
MTEQLDITQGPLLDNLIEMTLPGGEVIDLHNDFVCEKVEYEGARLRLHFLQDARVSTDDRRRIVVEFFDAAFTKLEVEGGLRSDMLGLGTLERIRCEVEGKVYDTLPDGNVMFLVDFYPDTSFEVTASRVIVLG